MTNGHVDVVRRAAALFDEVVVAVLANPAKPGRSRRPSGWTCSSRASPPTWRADGRRGSRSSVDGGLLVDYCRRIGAVAVVKGLRSGTDFAYELPMALMNRHLTGLETVFLPGDPRFEHVSSSLVKEVAAHGGDVCGLVPDVVLPRLLDRLAGRG